MGLFGYHTSNMEDFLAEYDLNFSDWDKEVSVENFIMSPGD